MGKDWENMIELCYLWSKLELALIVPSNIELIL